jgi:hypothetical protein
VRGKVAAVGLRLWKRHTPPARSSIVFNVTIRTSHAPVPLLGDGTLRHSPRDWSASELDCRCKASGSEQQRQPAYPCSPSCMLRRLCVRLPVRLQVGRHLLAARHAAVAHADPAAARLCG